jgi:hypothetical protein
MRSLFKPTLRVSANPVDYARPVEITYGDMILRVTVQSARDASNDVRESLRSGGEYSHGTERGEVVAEIGPLALELPRGLAMRFSDRLAQVAAIAETLVHSSGHFREFSRYTKVEREEFK